MRNLHCAWDYVSVCLGGLGWVWLAAALATHPGVASQAAVSLLLPPPVPLPLLLQAHNQQVINGLRRTLERTHARVEDLRNFRGVVFSGVFSHRFRCVWLGACAFKWTVSSLSRLLIRGRGECRLDLNRVFSGVFSHRFRCVWLGACFVGESICCGLPNKTRAQPDTPDGDWAGILANACIRT